MTKFLTIFWALAFATAFSSRPADAEVLVMSQSTEEIRITSNFTGAQQVVFGVIENGAPLQEGEAYDAVVTIIGPRGSVDVREKQAVGPLWLNADARKYIAIPAYISVLSNKKLDLVADVQTRRDMRIGVATLIPAQGDRTKAVDVRETEFRTALIRLREKQRLFSQNEDGVRFIAPYVFRANARIPGQAPLGVYTIEATVFFKGRAIAQESVKFSVFKSGGEEFVAAAARETPWLYGLGAMMMAIFSGWIASQIFRRD